MFINSASQFAKAAARPFYLMIKRARWVRRLQTADFSSGKIALGEQNGYRIDGSWITVDMADADFTMDFRQRKPLPFADASQDVVYSSHLIEHLDPQTLTHIFQESYRILKKGGYLRAEAPDLQKMIDAYQNNDRGILDYFAQSNRQRLVRKRGFPEVYAEDHVALLGFISCYIQDSVHTPVVTTKNEVNAHLNSMGVEEFAEWCISLQTPAQRLTCGHVNPIFFEKLYRMLNDVGFRDITSMANRETNIPNIDLKRIERSHRAFYSLYVEVRK
jgi:SAM-dependent methyltransferase